MPRKKSEIKIICGTGCPFARPTDTILLSLMSNKKVLLKNNIAEFESQMKDLVVQFSEK